MHEISIAVFAYPTTGRLSVCIDGSDLDVQAIEVRKTGDGQVVKVTEASGRVREYTKAGLKDTTVTQPPTAAERTAAARRDIATFFSREDDEN